MFEAYKNTIDYKTHNCILLAANRPAMAATAGTGIKNAVFGPVNQAADALDEVVQMALDDTVDELNMVE